MSRFFRWPVLLLVACATQPGEAAPGGEDEAVPAPAAGASASNVVATIGGVPVTRAELMEFAAPEIIAAEVAAHEARTNAVEALIADRLIDAEAEKHGISADELLEREIDDKLVPPKDEEVAAFYEENRGRINGPLDQVKPQIFEHLLRMKGSERMRAYVGELQAATEVVRTLEPYRVTVAPGDAPRWGSASAPIQIVEFSDFQCPYCSLGAATVDEVKEKYGDKVSIVFRHFPLPMHPQAPRAAEASACANEQGKFWEFHDALFAENKAWTDDDLTAMAKKVGAKKRPFAECLASDRHAKTVQADMEAGRAAGMQGTPGYYINGIVLGGAQPIERFVEVIDRELARK